MRVGFTVRKIVEFKRQTAIIIDFFFSLAVPGRPCLCFISFIFSIMSSLGTEEGRKSERLVSPPCSVVCGEYGNTNISVKHFVKGLPRSQKSYNGVIGVCDFCSLRRHGHGGEKA